jgi:hypothetical protein
MHMHMQAQLHMFVTRVRTALLSGVEARPFSLTTPWGVRPLRPHIS